MTENTQPESLDLADAFEHDSDEPELAAADGAPTNGAPEGDSAEATTDDEILPPSDLGDNAHQVVTALLGHQQDLVAELRSVYEQLEQVRQVEYAALESRVQDAEATVSAAPSSSELQELLTLLESVSSSLKEQEDRQSGFEQALREAESAYATQLAERDARIAAQNARIDQLEIAITAAAESGDSAHEKLDVLAKETESSLLHRMGERVSPAAQQARNALNTIRGRFRR
jgi:chromosome segregation ATPase